MARSPRGESKSPEKEKSIYYCAMQGDPNASDRELAVCYVSERGGEDREHVRCADDDGEGDPDESKRRATVGRMDKVGDGIHPAPEGERRRRFERSHPWRHSGGDNREGDHRWGCFIFYFLIFSETKIIISEIGKDNHAFIKTVADGISEYPLADDETRGRLVERVISIFQE